MKELSFEQIIDLANSKGFQVSERCLELSGYPRTNSDRIVTGFDDFESLKEFIEDAGVGEPSLFKRKDGWHRTFQYYVGWMDRPLSVEEYVNDLGDDYNILYDFDSEVEYAKEVVSEMMGRGELDAASRYLTELSCLKESWEGKDDSEVIIMSGSEYYETMDKEMMRYREDNWTWEVGVWVPYFETELNNEDNE